MEDDKNVLPLIIIMFIISLIALVPNISFSYMSSFAASNRVSFKVPPMDYLMVQDDSDLILGSTYNKNSIQQIIINNTNTVPSGAVYSWNVSQAGDASIKAYLMPGSGTGNYKLYIGQNGGVKANPDSSNLFSGYYNVTSINATYLKTDYVESMEGMFTRAGYMSASLTLTGLNTWNVSNVKNMWGMFKETAHSVSGGITLNLSSWNVSNVEDIGFMFVGFGEMASGTVTLNVTDWNVSNVTSMFSTFSSFEGNGPTTVNIVGLNNWNVSKVTDMTGMFSRVGWQATSFNIGNLSSWNVSNVTNMSGMFDQMGQKATSWNIGNISNWNVSNVTNMSRMFEYVAYTAEAPFSMNLSSWNVSNVTDMSYMFYYTGRNATSFSLGNLSNWNTSNVGNMSYMFSYAGRYASTFTSLGTLKVYGYNVSNMFYYCYYCKATLNVYNNPSSYDSMFSQASRASGSSITVNYRSSVSNIDAMIATKSSSSNIIKGSVIT